jgi:hypothetical protein
MLFTVLVAGPIKLQSNSIMIRYFFVDCQFSDLIRVMQGNVASLKYYNEGTVSDISCEFYVRYKLWTLIYLNFNKRKMVYNKQNNSY